MHELSLCHAIVEVVRPHVGVRRIDTVHLRVGALRQVVPETLTFCWDIVAEHEDLDGAAPDIDWVEASVACAGCTLTFCWDIVAEHEDLDGAAPDIDWVEASVACAGCTPTPPTTSPFSIVCPKCGSARVEALTCEEFLVTSLDVSAPVDDMPARTHESG